MALKVWRFCGLAKSGCKGLGQKKHTWPSIQHHSRSLSTLTAVSFFVSSTFNLRKRAIPMSTQSQLKPFSTSLHFFTFCLHHQTYQEPEIVYPPLAPVMASSSSPTWKTLGNVDPATGFGWCRLVIDLIVGASLSSWHEPFVQNKPKSTLGRAPHRKPPARLIIH